MKHEDPVKTRRVDLNGGEKLYAWLRDTADEVLAADPEWQVWEQSIEAAFKAFPFLSDMQKTECEQGPDSQEAAR